MILSMEYSANSRDIVDLITSKITERIDLDKEHTDIKKIQAYLFLINDILFNAANN